MNNPTTPPAVTPDLTMLIYTSSAHREMTQPELDKILQKSRINNVRRQVTGVLLYKTGNFLQVMEGAEKSVLEVFAVVSKDPRHHQVTMILKRPIYRREFSNWAMGFARMDDISPSRIAGFTSYMLETMSEIPYGTGGSIANEFMEAFREGNR